MQGHWLDKLAKGVVTGARRPVTLKVLTGSARRTLIARALMVGALLIGLSVLAPLGSGQVRAQEPANDEVANATDVPGIPFQDGPIDTSAATAAEDDPQDCFNNGSVWYTFTPTEDVSIEVNTIDSDYDTTLGVYEGSPDSLSLIDCNDDFYGLQSAIRFDAAAGTTYYFMVGLCCGNGENGGGTLFFNVRDVADIPPPPEISLVVNAQGSFDKAGAATIGGTITCDREVPFTGVSGTLRQRVGRRFITGDFFVEPGPCSPSSSSWSATVIGDGVFRGGQVMADVNATACDEFECGEDSVTMTIRLRGGNKS